MKVHVSSSLPEKVFCDIKRYKQVLFNLIGNAIKFTYTGEIAVNLEFNSVTRIMSTYVRDTGLGIKAKDLSKLFKFFG